MPVPLVETKFFVPQGRSGLVPRPRLDLGPGGARLTLVSAPAGFGKTTLLTAWLAAPADAGERRTAWVSLDASDTKPDTFWTYVLTALERSAPGSGAAGLALLGAGQPIETVLAAVLNELSVLPDDVTLVLDDYHLAEGPDLQPGMAFLVEHLPPQLRLVISTRADPALPLARMRARGELAEVRAADLRFTRDEATAYLAEATGLDLDAADVAALEARTEGWIASLQLAALSLRDREDPSRFIAGFTGDDRYVVDYLVDEVLDREPAEVRDFLLSTAILERLTGPLCDAVTESTGSGRMLESLDRRNLFVVPLDDQRRWYRYHHLFADVLRTHLHAEQPERVAGLHRRASDWYDEAGEPEPAVRHALAADDVERAAELVELAIPELARVRREAVFRAWADLIPEQVLRNRPVLAMGLIGGRMSSNEFDGVEERLQDIERQLALPAGELVVLDRDELARVPASIEMYRAALALNHGDPVATIAHAERTLALAAEEDNLPRAAASALSGLASWAMGDLEAAHRGYTIATEGLRSVGRIADVCGTTITLADLELTLGRLDVAERAIERALELAAAEGPGLRGVPDMHVALSRVVWERNDLSAAADHLRRADELDDSTALPQNPYRWRLAMARLREAEGDSATALHLLEEAERVYVGDYSPNVRPMPAVHARMLAAHGRVDEALDWARRQGLSTDDELSYLREYEHVTLARILLAQESTESRRDASALLERLREAAEDGGRTGTVIEILALQALAQLEVAPLERALTLAEPGGWIRVFVGEGPPMVKLLEALARDRPDWAYLRRVLDAGKQGGQPASESPQPHQQALIDPLSDRELDVLRLLASDLDGPDIARHLVVSLNTVRTHTKHIYTKLGVNNRRSAVRRAHQLGLLAGPG